MLIAHFIHHAAVNYFIKMFKLAVKMVLMEFFRYKKKNKKRYLFKNTFFCFVLLVCLIIGCLLRHYRLHWCLHLQQHYYKKQKLANLHRHLDRMNVGADGQIDLFFDEFRYYHYYLMLRHFRLHWHLHEVQYYT